MPSQPGPATDVCRSCSPCSSSSGRALWWGIAYLLVWETGIARASEGASRLSVGGYARSALARVADVDVELGGRSLLLSLVVLVAVTLGGWLAATHRYRRAEIA